jgi:phosphate transport system permease protein
MKRTPPVYSPNGYDDNNLPQRHRTGSVWLWIFRASTIIGIIALSLLLFNILNQTSGYSAVKFQIDPDSLAIDGIPLGEMDSTQLIQVLENNLNTNRFRTLDRQTPLAERDIEDLYTLVQDNVIQPTIEDTWSLWDSLVNKPKIQAELAKKYPDAELVFSNWLTAKFVSRPQDPDALQAGVRTAIMGSIWTIIITITVALPVGISAAIYLEEYATDNWINRAIRTNINNLAGVPSIIYGMLGLAIFVRSLEQFTSGAIFGLSDDPTTANGRTILSAGLTLALLVLPVIIINAQEAIRAVPLSLRQASYGLGATKWQTVWYHVLPNALSGILTGTILAISRAIGETAPLVVVGASTYITFDPTGPFSKFTTLPIQIYQWTSRAQNEFRNLAAAAILVLLLLLLSMNAIAVLLRHRYSRRH